MKSNHRKGKNQWVRAMAALMVFVMLTFAMPLSALAEEVQPEQTEVGSGDEAVSSSVEAGDGTAAFELGDPGEMDVPVDEPMEAEAEIDVGENEIIIVGFEDQDKGEFRLAQKPTLDLVRANLPGTVMAHIAGLDAPVEIPVEWQCDDYDDQNYGTFVFVARFSQEKVNIGGVEVNAEDILFKKGVKLPQVRVVVVYITGFEPVQEGEYVLEEKPESVNDAVEAMGLPDTVYGTLSDSERVQGFSVTWTCENYDDASAGEYVFTAEFDGPAYELGASVEMPEVIVKAAGDIINVKSLAALEKTEYVMTEKPLTAEDAVKEMKLPETIDATVEGAADAVPLAFTWSCARYDKMDAGDFTFVASPVDKLVELGDIDAPEVTLTVVADDEFEVTVNEDNTLTITGLKEGVAVSKDMTIPEVVSGIPVTVVGDDAFKGKTEISSVDMDSENLQKVGDRAFADCAALKEITLSDRIRSFSKTALENATPTDGVHFNVYGKTALTGADRFKPTVNDKAADEVILPVAVTDIEVMEEGALTMNTDFVIGENHVFSVDEGGSAMIPAEFSIVNHGAIENSDGILVNNGNIYSCDTRAYEIEGVITGNAPVLAHVADEEGICEHCGSQRLRIGLAEDSKAVLDKIYDGTTIIELDDKDLAPLNADPEAGVEIYTGFTSDEDSESFDESYCYATADVGEKIRILARNLEIDYDKEHFNYFVDEESFEIYGKITPFDISTTDTEGNDSNSEVFRGVYVEVEDQTYTGKEIKPDVKVTFDSTNLDDEVKLEAGKDYTLSFENNKKVGTAKAVITGMGNFTGVFKQEFEIDEKDSSSSGGGSSSSSSGDDDDDDDDTEEEEEDDTGVLMIEDENYGRVLFGRDYLPRPFDQFDEEIGESEAPAEENLPKRLIIEPTPMVDAIGQTLYIDAEQTREKFETVHLRLTNEQIANLQKQGFVELLYELEYARLRIPLSLLQSSIQLAAQADDADGTDTATKVDMYDFCIEQVNGTQLDERESLAMEGLNPVYAMYRIEVNAVSGEYPKPDIKKNEEAEAQTEEAPAVPQQFDTLIAPEQSFVLERLGYVSDIGVSAAMPEAAEGEESKLPAGCTGEIFFSANPLNKSGTELTEAQVIASGARDGGVIEIYSSIHEAADRDNALAVYDGTLFSDYHTRVGSCVVRLSCRLDDAQRKILEQEIVQALTASSPSQIESGFDKALPTLYPILNVFNAQYAVEETEPRSVEMIEEPEQIVWQPGGAKLELINEDSVELPEDARQLFVPADAVDAAAAMSTLHYTEGLYDDYATVYPMGSGLYGVVTATSPDEENEDEWEEDNEAEAEAETVEEAPAEAPVTVEDQDPQELYAYSRSANEGDMYWLINATRHTVEFYREDTGTYLIGDFTGSLKTGMSVQYRDNGSRVEIRLRYPQTYKFATTTANDKEILMEQKDVASVESIMADVR